jgi:antitoxin component YwqK of YwqJK toxin-antitoxin module
MRLLFVLLFLTTNSFGQSFILCKDVQGVEVDNSYVLGSNGWFYTYDQERLKDYTGNVKVCRGGKLYSKIKYVNGLPNGPYVRYNTNDGRIFETGNYLNGIKHGPWVYYEYGNSYVSVEKGQYNKGYKVGEWIDSSDNGQIISKKNYIVDTLYNPNYRQQWSSENSFSQEEINKLLQEEQIQGFEILHGQWIQYYSNGQIMEKTNYLNGVKDGESIQYHENGQIMEKTNYLNGIQEGESIRYYSNGQIQSKINRYGEWIEQYDENGILQN